ncbi:hypothetical protein BT69DRAFT_185382 [Atractiella rhizophila]|nr:hypothetical protein BT69DRAFT_185382 [Atractiella rhizophila]
MNFPSFSSKRQSAHQPSSLSLRPPSSSSAHSVPTLSPFGNATSPLGNTALGSGIGSAGFIPPSPLDIGVLTAFPAPPRPPLASKSNSKSSMSPPTSPSHGDEEEEEGYSYGESESEGDGDVDVVTVETKRRRKRDSWESAVTHRSLVLEFESDSPWCLRIHPLSRRRSGRRQWKY